MSGANELFKSRYYASNEKCNFSGSMNLGILLILPLMVYSLGQMKAGYCGICEYHTMCNTEISGPSCINHQSMPPNEEEKQTLLDIHNKFRNKVALGEEKQGKPGPQYKATNMMKMEWDEELAIIAQRAADQCSSSHDCGACRLVRRDRFNVGQNIAVQWNSNQQTAVNFTGMVGNWYLDEVGLMDKEYAKSYKFGNWGHYSQVVWWNSRLVGCGAAFYDENGWKYQLLFCNYGPLGNIVNAKMYEIGSPASDCPENTLPNDHTYPGLCVIQDPPSDGTFHTDDVLLGFPPGTYLVPPKCENKD